MRRKLYAGIVLSSNENEPTTKQQATDIINKLKSGLPDDCILGYENPAVVLSR